MANLVQSGKYDCSIINAAGTEIGLTLTKIKRDGGEYLNYREYTDSKLAQQFFSSAPDYGYLPAEKEFREGQDDWRAGFGKEYFDSNDPKRYFYTINADARFEGEVRLGPLAATATKPATITTEATLTETDFTTANNWTGVTSSNTRYKLSVANSGLVNNAEGYQDAATWATAWQSKTFMVGVWIYATAASTGRVGISNKVGDTPTYSSYHTGVAGWEFLVVKKTLDADATRLRVLLVSATVSDVWFDDVSLGSPVPGSMPKGADFYSERYQPYGQILMKQNAGGTGYDIAGCFPTAITRIHPATVAGVDYLFIMFGWSNYYWYMSTAEVFLQSDLAISGTKLKHMQVIGLTFFASDSNSTIASTTAPLNGGTDWASGLQIGLDTYDITELLEYNNLLYVMKEDKPYYRDGAGAAQVLADEVVNLGGSNGGENSIVWHNAIYMPYGEQGLLEYDGTYLTWISPSLYMNNLSDFSGEVQALAGDDHFLYAILDDGADIQLLAAKEETVSGTTAWRWHPLATILTLTGCQSADISSEVKKRLWVGSTDSDNSFYYYPITTKYGSIGSDTDITYQTGGYLITPWLHLNLKGDKKAWYVITLTMSGTTSAIYWEAHYQKLGDSAWTDIGDFKTSPTTEAYLPVDGSTISPQSTMMRFKFVGVTPSTYTTSPVLLGYDVRGVWYPKQRTIIELQVQCVDEKLLKDGLQDETQTSATVRSALDGLRNPTTAWPVKFYPPYWLSSSDTKYVKLLTPSQYRPTRLEREVERFQGVYDIQLLVVDGLTF